MEFELIEWLRARVPVPPAVQVGIGDDAAVLALGAERVVVTSDMLMDGIDFELRKCDPRQVGRKALAVNLSDLAAMASRPTAAIISLALPKAGGQPMATAFYEGLFPLADEFQVAIAGGDTNSWGGPFVVSITLLGHPTGTGPVLRSGGQIGDELLVTGAFGGSILGRHFEFAPRVEEAIWIHEREEVHAAIDVSDGLSLDLARLATASGCGAEVVLDQIPVSPDARRLASEEGEKASPLQHALADGEDFELILAVPLPVAGRLLAAQPLSVPLTRIGRLVAEPGLWQLHHDRSRTSLIPQGYEH